MAEIVARVHTHTHTHGDLINKNKVEEKSYLYINVYKTDQLII